MRCRKARAVHGPDVWASVSPKGQIFAALAVLLPVALSGLALLALAPPFWWVFTTYFWVSFPALGLLRRGLKGLSNRGVLPSAKATGEREILEALRGHGELTAIQAAMETSLAVAEANEVLEGLSENGHLKVRARGGTLSYALWDSPGWNVQQGAVREQQGPWPKLLEPSREAARQGLKGVEGERRA